MFVAILHILKPYFCVVNNLKESNIIRSESRASALPTNILAHYLLVTQLNTRTMEAKTMLEFLKVQPLLAHATPSELDYLMERSVSRKLNRYHFIYLPDDVADYVHFLVKGDIKFGSFSEDGREVIKAILKPFAFFGEESLSGMEKRMDFAQVQSDVAEVVSFRSEDFQRLLHTNHALLLDFSKHLTQRLIRIEERLSSLILKDARSRIIDFILDTASREGRRVGYETLIKHQLTQQDIANLTGTSRQTVTSVFNDLRRHNLIYFNRNTLLIRDIEKLA
jgi:CRP/FNR family transcriptional regulator, cyclic AMP receptor protein